MSEGALLEVENLRVEYGGRGAVDGVSFALGRGRCLGVIGESGAGKSQSFLALMGLLPRKARVSGEARLAGVSLLSPEGTNLRGRDVAMIFQDPMTSLTPHLSIGDQVAEPLVQHRGMSWDDARGQAARLLEEVRMTDVPRRLEQYPHELSGGMRQRAMIAMALACDPALLIADEPTTALDVSVQAQILGLLRSIVDARGAALAVITHDLGVIAALADDVLVMRAGSIVERGSVAHILKSPDHEYTRGLLAATPRIDAPGASAPTESPSGETPLVVRDVHVHHAVRSGGWRRRRGTLAAVDGVGFEIAAGEALGIVGESGSGKSTLTRALLRLLPVARGEIVWLGRPIQDLGGEELRQARAGFQIVFQDPFASLDPRMRVADIVAEPLVALRPELSTSERADRVAAMLARVGLGAEYAGRRSRELSGGQCQRVAIARAMILEPKLLVCDEAVSALDVSIQAQVLELLESIKREQGTSIIFVSHNLAVVRQLCERILVMYLGREVESGATDAVFRAPRHPYTRLLLDSVPSVDPVAGRARLANLGPRDEMPSAFQRPEGCAFRSRCPAALPTCAARSPEPEDAGEARKVACLRWRELVNQP